MKLTLKFEVAETVDDDVYTKEVMGALYISKDYEWTYTQTGS